MTGARQFRCPTIIAITTQSTLATLSPTTLGVKSSTHGLVQLATSPKVAGITCALELW